MGLTANLLIIILTCIVSYYGFNNQSIFHRFKHYPYQEERDKNFIRWLTAGFLHGSMPHLAINMLVLYQFGTAVEYYFMSQKGIVLGRSIYVLSYVLMIVLANIPTYLKHKNNPRFASIGASGAVSGILFMFIMMQPWTKLKLFFVIPCPAILAGILYLIYSSWASKNSNDYIDHDAHFYGALAGIVLMISLNPSIFNEFVQKVSNLPF